MEARLGEIDAALTECRKAIALLQEITEDASDGRERSRRAQAYEYLGYAYVALAASQKASAREARQRMSGTRDMFQQAANVLEDLRSRGTLDQHNEGYAKEIAGEIAKGEAALAK